MTEKEIKRMARTIHRQYKDIDSYKELRRVAESEGYTVIEFRRVNNSLDVSTVINALHLNEVVRRERGFTYSDANYRLIFIYEDLTDQEKRIVLLHELCHIWLGHMATPVTIGFDVRQEHEANELGHYLMYSGVSIKMDSFLSRHRRLSIACLIAMMFFLSGLFGYRQYKKQQTYYGNYYVTENGAKYHLKNCITIRGSKLRRLTKEDIESGNYKACGVCLPQ